MCFSPIASALKRNVLERFRLSFPGFVKPYMTLIARHVLLGADGLAVSRKTAPPKFHNRLLAGLSAGDLKLLVPVGDEQSFCSGNRG